MEIRASSILIGALFTLALISVFASLAGAIGISSVALERRELPDFAAGWGSLAYAAVTVAVSFFLGSYLATRSAEQRSSFGARAHALGVWSLASVLLVYFIVGLASQAGVEATRAASVDGMLKRLSKLELQVVSSFSIVKGEAKGRIFMKPGAVDSQPPLMAEGKNALKKEVRSLVPRGNQAGVKSAMRDVRKAAGQASWAGFSALLLGAIASLVGGVAGKLSRPNLGPLATARAARARVDREPSEPSIL